jgi:quinol monooxygenase YgiN
MSNIPRSTADTTILSVVLALISGCSATRDHAIGRYQNVPAGAYAIVAEVRAKPGKENELRTATLPLVTQVRHEPNNLLYFLHEDRNAPGHFVFYEIFSSRQDFDAHNASSHVQAWFARLLQLAEGDVTVTHLEILGN